ncbi:MAG: hypothetical protein HY727_19850 [Candidatus Rokubacteria bacterium]|nr:hypothetical protein [Candidatus Rokubacteria bacterium]
MSRLRRYYHRRFGYHERFHLAVLLTIILVAYAAVPPVVRWVESVGGYNPTHYEPKDLARETWLRGVGVTGVEEVSWELVVNVVLFLLVAILWLTLVPTRTTRRRSPPR